MKKIIIFIILGIILIIGCICFSGYQTYSKALSKTPLSKKVSSVQTSSNFVKYDDLSEDLINATIAVEDHRFFDHGAIDIVSICRAIFSDIKAKDTVEGGSTITQQVAKNLYFMNESDSLSRKIAEFIVSYHLEKNYSKQEIFELYVNTIYYGNGYYGISSASQGYFKKDPNKLTISESTLLAGIPNAPSVYAPTANMDLCKKRQQKVIDSMVKYNYITQSEANKIILGANFKE